MCYKSEICFHILKHFQETLIIITYNVVYLIKKMVKISLTQVATRACNENHHNKMMLQFPTQQLHHQIFTCSTKSFTPFRQWFFLYYHHQMSLHVILSTIWNRWFFHFLFNHHVSYCNVNYCKGLHKCKQNKNKKELQG